MTTVTDTEYDNLSEHDRAQVKRIVVVNPRLDLLEISRRYGHIEELDLRSWHGLYIPLAFWRGCTGKKLLLAQDRMNAVPNCDIPFKTVVCKWFMCIRCDDGSNVENVSCYTLAAALGYVVPLNIKTDIIRINNPNGESLHEFRQKFDHTFSRCQNVECRQVTVCSTTKGGDDWQPYLIQEEPEHFVYHLPWKRMAVDNDFDQLFE